MTSEDQIVTEFYRAFQALDAEAMVACYHQDIVFEDPAFGQLKGEHACNMWRMLCASQKGKDFEVNHFLLDANGGETQHHWTADYTFSKTNRKVHNSIQASFKFKDGKIVEHIDTFSMQNWAKQAFGMKGWLLGGTSFFKKKLQQQTNGMLHKYELKHI